MYAGFGQFPEPVKRKAVRIPRDRTKIRHRRPCCEGKGVLGEPSIGNSANWWCIFGTNHACSLERGGRSQ